MIAPDPALAGPRPSAPPREAARAAEPERPSGGDFDSVLKEPAAEKEADRGAGKAESAPGPDAAPPAPEANHGACGDGPRRGASAGGRRALRRRPAFRSRRLPCRFPPPPPSLRRPAAPAPEAAAPPPPERMEAAEVPKADAKVTAAPARGDVVRRRRRHARGRVGAAEGDRRRAAGGRRWPRRRRARRGRRRLRCARCRPGPPLRRRRLRVATACRA